MKALFHWTGVRCVFEPLLILRARCPGNSNRDSQAIDSSRGSAAHFLFNCRRGSGEVKGETTERRVTTRGSCYENRTYRSHPHEQTEQFDFRCKLLMYVYCIDSLRVRCYDGGERGIPPSQLGA